MAETLSGVGHWRSDIPTGMTVISPQMAAICGIARDTAIDARYFVERVHADDRERLLAAMAAVRDTGEVNDFRFRWNRPDGGTIHMTLSCRQDGLQTLFGIVRESSDEVDREQALIAARDQARAAERVHAEMLRVVDEQVREPIREMMTLRDADPQQQSMASVMATLDELIDPSPTDEEHVTFESRDFDLKALIRSTAQSYLSYAIAKGLILEAKGLDDGAAMVRGDPARVQEIVSNLLSNAINFTDTGNIVVSASTSRRTVDTHYWMVVVRGNGVGIRQEALARIFSRFEQVDAARSRLQGGAGIGLSVSQQLAEAMGGSIAVASQPGQGSTFSVELPFRVRAKMPAVARNPLAAEGPLRILMAEDNPINRRLMSALLGRNGHEVVAVEDGRKAMAAMTTQSFDLVLMDMQMPELDGLGATRAIRALGLPASQTVIIGISADAAPDRRRLYFEAGVDNFLPKPIVARQLIETIEKLRQDPESLAEETTDRFDRERLSWLLEKASERDAAVLMHMLLFDVTDRPQRIAAAVRARAWEVAATESESLRALLDNFGEFGLSQLLGVIARRCARRSLPLALLDELANEAAALANFFQSELGGLPAPLERAVDNVVPSDFSQPAQQQG